MNSLVSTTDKRHALRVAVQRATEEIIENVWEFSDDQIERAYGNLRHGRLSIDWTLTHPDDVEPSDERMLG